MKFYSLAAAALLGGLALGLIGNLSSVAYAQQPAEETAVLESTAEPAGTASNGASNGASNAESNAKRTAVASDDSALSGQELAIDSYELTINGKSFDIQLGEQLRVPPVKALKDGNNRYSVQIAPTQLAKMNTLQLRYPYPSRAFDDEEKKERTIRVYHEMGFAILVTDFGGPLNNPETSIPKIVDVLKETLREELVGGLKNPKEASSKLEYVTKNGTRVNGVIVQVKLSDVKIVEAAAFTISNEKFFATLTLQLFGIPFEHVRGKIKDMLESFEPK